MILFYATWVWTESLLNETQSWRLPQSELSGPPAGIECSAPPGPCNSSAGCLRVDGQLDRAALRSCYPESRPGCAALPARRALSPPTFLHAGVQEGQLPERNLGSRQLHWNAAPHEKTAAGQKRCCRRDCLSLNRPKSACQPVSNPLLCSLA